MKLPARMGLALAASSLLMIAGCARRAYYAPVGYAPPVVVVHHYGPGYGGGYGYRGGPAVVHVHHYGAGGYGGYGGGYGRGPIVVHHYHHY